jgi:hypothetical protein
MHRLNLLLLIVIAYAGFDLFRTLRTGRAHTWMNGTATRERQPGRYWRYVYSGWVVLAFFAGALVWSLLWPESLSR